MTEKSRASKKRAVAGATASSARAQHVNITGYFDVSVRASLRLIQAQHPEAQVRDLLAEALNLLFAKYGVPQTAPKSGYAKL